MLSSSSNIEAFLFFRRLKTISTSGIRATRSGRVGGERRGSGEGGGRRGSHGEEGTGPRVGGGRGVVGRIGEEEGRIGEGEGGITLGIAVTSTEAITTGEGRDGVTLRCLEHCWK